MNPFAAIAAAVALARGQIQRAAQAKFLAEGGHVGRGDGNRRTPRSRTPGGSDASRDQTGSAVGRGRRHAEGRDHLPRARSPGARSPGVARRWGLPVRFPTPDEMDGAVGAFMALVGVAIVACWALGAIGLI